MDRGLCGVERSLLFSWVVVRLSKPFLRRAIWEGVFAWVVGSFGWVHLNHDGHY